MATTASKGEAPFSADQLNRFRMAHPERELRSLLRRLHRLPIELEAATPDDAAADRELARLEVDKWRLGVERMVASVGNLERQREGYRRRAVETARRTEDLRGVLAAEKALLAQRQTERDHRVRCDEVAKKIIARGVTRSQLEEQISTLQAAIAEHRAAYDEVVAVATARAETFGRIGALVDECRALKLPDSVTVGMDAEPPAQQRLSAVSLPFQPRAESSTPGNNGGNAGGGSAGVSSAAMASAATLQLPERPHMGGTGSRSAPASRAQTPAPQAHPHAHSQSPAHAAHNLPSRPQRGPSGGRMRQHPGLPPRPSGLRVASRPGLEDGEVESEDGEVREGKRKAEAGHEGRVTRARK